MGFQDAFDEREVVEVDGTAEAEDGVDHFFYLFFLVFGKKKRREKKMRKRIKGKKGGRWNGVLWVKGKKKGWVRGCKRFVQEDFNVG